MQFVRCGSMLLRAQHLQDDDKYEEGVCAGFIISADQGSGLAAFSASGSASSLCGVAACCCMRSI